MCQFVVASRAWWRVHVRPVSCVEIVMLLWLLQQAEFGMLVLWSLSNHFLWTPSCWTHRRTPISHWCPTTHSLPRVICYWLRQQKSRFRRFFTVDQRLLQDLHPHISEPLGTMPTGRPPDCQTQKGILLLPLVAVIPDANCTKCIRSLKLSSVVVVDLDHLSCCTLYNVSTYTCII